MLNDISVMTFFRAGKKFWIKKNNTKKQNRVFRNQKIAPIFLLYVPTGASLVAQMVKRLPTMRETWVQFLGWEDPLEKEMAIHSSTLAWKIPCTEKPDRLQSMG